MSDLGSMADKFSETGKKVVRRAIEISKSLDHNHLPLSIQSLIYRNAISVRPDPDFHNDVDRLIKGIELHFKNNL